MKKQDVIAEKMARELAGGIGRRVRTLRQDKGISMEELARRANLGIHTLNLLELGESNPTITTIAKVARALNTDPHEILGG